MRIPPPNYTQTPNDLFDHWLPLLSESELKVLLVIMRKTFGWHKVRDRISNSQLAKFTGMLEETVIKAAKSLHSKGVITRNVIGTIGKQETYYELVIQEDSNNSYPSVQPSGPLGSNPPVQTESQKKLYPKETITKEIAAAKENGAASDKKNVSHSLIFKNTKGEATPVSESDIYKYFLKLPYSTEEIQEAIEVVRSSNDFVGNIFKYIEAICNRIHNSKSFKINDLKKKTECDIPDTSKEPKVNFGEAMKKRAMEKKNETK